MCRSNRQYLVIVHFLCLVLSILDLFLHTYNCEWGCDVCELDVSKQAAVIMLLPLCGSLYPIEKIHDYKHNGLFDFRSTKSQPVFS